MDLLAMIRKGTWGEIVYWVYANLNMFKARRGSGKEKYDRVCYMVRSKAFKSYKDGKWQIHSLYEDNILKMDWGKSHCWYCGRAVEECGKLTVEHILPKIRGGENNFDNIAYACKSCNSSKSDKDLITWMVDTNGVMPSIDLICIYMKLVYNYSAEHDLMNLKFDDIEHLDLPFDYKSLNRILEAIKNYEIKD